MPGLVGYIALGNADEVRRAYATRLASAAAALAHDAHDSVRTLDHGAGSVAVVAPRAPAWAAAIGATAGPGAVACYGTVRPAAGAPADAMASARDAARTVLESGGRTAPEGSYLLFAHDGVRNVATLTADHYASRPVFVRVADDAVLFAPELRALALLAGSRFEHRAETVLTFLLNGHLLADQTPFAGVDSLPPGTTLVVADGRVSYARHWEYRLRPAADSADDAETVERLAALLRDAARRQVALHTPLLIPISGGWDSRGILAAVHEAGARDIQTVSWGVEEETPGTDAFVGRALARHFGVRHTFLRRESGDLPDDLDRMLSRMEGLTDDAALHHNELRIIERARDELGATVLLRGDECFGFGGPAETETEAFRRVAIHSPDDVPLVRRLLKQDVAPDLLARATGVMREISASCREADFLDRKDSFYFHQRLRHYLNRSTYYKLSVLEVQNPWLDRPILDFVATIPRRLRLDKQLYRLALPVMYPALRSIPFATRHSLEDWGDVIRGSSRIREYLADQLLGSRNRFHDLIDVAPLDGLLTGILAGTAAAAPPGSSKLRAILRRSPRLYRFLKRSVAGRFAPADVPPTTILLRALVAKRWFDRFESTLV